jgi:hypothetical protein
MAATSFWAMEAPAVEHPASFEIADATSAEAGLNSNELRSRILPPIVGNSAALRRVLDMGALRSGRRHTEELCSICARMDQETTTWKVALQGLGAWASKV